jgi:aminocarboxymuconate-semialdehyde decarboxylase
VDGALAELAYALDVLKLDGVVLFSNVNGIYLGDKRFEPVFEELERRSAVVFVHPMASPDLAAHQLGLPDSLIDFTADTTRAVAQMLYSNRFARTPSVKYILSHAGGVIPYLAGRFAIVDEMNVVPGGDVRGAAPAALRRLHYDTALSANPPVLNMLREEVGLTQVLFGTDYPYLRHDIAVRSAHEMRQTATLAEAERQAVLHENARRLFPRLSGVLAA